MYFYNPSVWHRICKAAFSEIPAVCMSDAKVNMAIHFSCLDCSLLHTITVILTEISTCFFAASSTVLPSSLSSIISCQEQESCHSLISECDICSSCHSPCLSFQEMGLGIPWARVKVQIFLHTILHYTLCFPPYRNQLCKQKLQKENTISLSKYKWLQWPFSGFCT